MQDFVGQYYVSIWHAGDEYFMSLVSNDIEAQPVVRWLNDHYPDLEVTVKNESNTAYGWGAFYTRVHLKHYNDVPLPCKQPQPDYC